MSAIPASSVSLKTMADGTLRVSFDIEPSQAQDAFRLFAAPGTQVAIAALRDGSFLEQTSAQAAPDAAIPASEKPPRAHMGDACYRVVMWCADSLFWEWIGSVGVSCPSEKYARQFVLDTCGVTSRKELDTDNEANKAFHRLIREPYRLWLIKQAPAQQTPTQAAIN